MKRTPIKRRTRLRPYNAKRRARLFKRNFGEHSDWIRTMDCVACVQLGEQQKSPTIAHHTRTRGAGGDRRHLVPICQNHHLLIHDNNLPYPSREDLLEEAARLWDQSPHREEDAA